MKTTPECENDSATCGSIRADYGHACSRTVRRQLLHLSSVWIGKYNLSAERACVMEQVKGRGGRQEDEMEFKDWDDGFVARLRGETFDMNPHPMATDSWRKWAEGWNDQNEHLNDRDDALASIGWFG